MIMTLLEYTSINKCLKCKSIDIFISREVFGGSVSSAGGSVPSSIVSLEHLELLFLLSLFVERLLLKQLFLFLQLLFDADLECNSVDDVPRNGGQSLCNFFFDLYHTFLLVVCLLDPVQQTPQSVFLFVLEKLVPALLEFRLEGQLLFCQWLAVPAPLGLLLEPVDIVVQHNIVLILVVKLELDYALHTRLVSPPLLHRADHTAPLCYFFPNWFPILHYHKLKHINKITFLLASICAPLFRFSAQYSSIFSGDSNLLRQYSMTLDCSNSFILA